MGTLTDPIADFLIRLKNASRAGNDTFTAPHSKMKVELARILKEEGYIMELRGRHLREIPRGSS